MNQETLQSKELLPSHTNEDHTAETALNKSEVDELYSSRQNSLSHIKSVVSLKFYHYIEGKLQQEKKLFEQLLHLEDSKQELLSHYSFVLNPYYFEQKFISR